MTTMISAPIRKSLNSASTRGGYIKGQAPSVEALRCEAEFKDLCSGMKEFKAPPFMKFGGRYVWSKIDKVKDRFHKDQYLFILDSVQQGMGNSHPGVNLRDLPLERVFDFVLGVDLTLQYKLPFHKDPIQLGFDVTCNPYVPEAKAVKVKESYRGAKLRLLKEFGFQGYIPILWLVSDYPSRDKCELGNQLLRGLGMWDPGEFTHIITIK